MNYKFCPYCGGKLKKENEGFKCISCGKWTFINPKPAVGVFIVKGKKVLLSKRARDPNKGKWAVIGGFSAVFETTTETGVREALEETGLEIRLVKLLTEQTLEYGPYKEPLLQFFYLGRIVGGIIKIDSELEQVKWFDIDKIPTLAAVTENKALDVLRKYLSGK